MELQHGSFCPLLKKDCIQMKCMWFTHIMGTNPNTGKDTDEWTCAIAWLPVLLVENSGQQRQTGAAVESFRNEMVRANKASTQALLNTLVIAHEKEREQRLSIGGKNVLD
jgi:hypothetical protein